MHEALIEFGKPLRGVSLVNPATPALHAAPSAANTGAAVSSMVNAGEQEVNHQREALEKVLSGLTECVQQLFEQQQQRLQEMQQAAVELAMAVASRLLHDKIAAGDYPVEKLVHQVVDRLGSKQAVKVYLHPQDLALLKQRLGNDYPELGEKGDLQISGDPAMARGDCRADAGEVSVLSQLEIQLADIRQHLLGGMAHAEVERRKTLPRNPELRRFPDRRQTG